MKYATVQIFEALIGDNWSLNILTVTQIAKKKKKKTLHKSATYNVENSALPTQELIYILNILKRMTVLLNVKIWLYSLYFSSRRK